MSLQIKQLDEFTVIGPKCVGKTPAEMGQMWEEFIPRIGEVTNRVGGHFYGLMYTDPSLPVFRDLSGAGRNGNPETRPPLDRLRTG